MTGPCSRLSSLKDHNRWTSTPCSIQPRPNLCRRWSKSRSRQSLSSISWVQLPRGLLDAQERAGTGSSRAHELVPLPGHHLSQPSRGGGPGCPTGPQGPQKRGHWRKTADRRAVSVEGQSHHTPPTTPVLILWDFLLGCLSLPGGSDLAPSSLWLALTSGAWEGWRLPRDQWTPEGGVLPQSHGVLQAERGPSTALWGGVWQGILTVPQRRSGWAPGQASGSVIGICCHLAQVRELQKGWAVVVGARNLGSRGTQPGKLALPFPPAAPFILFH